MFFDQIKELDGNIKALRDHLKSIGGAVDQQLELIGQDLQNDLTVPVFRGRP